MLSRFGPLGLSVLALLASFVIVLTAGGVLATSSKPAPPPSPTPTAPKPTTVHINLAALQDGRDVDVPEGVEPSLRTNPPPPLGGPTAASGPVMSGQPVTLLCLTLSAQWSPPRRSDGWIEYGKAYCRSVDPQREPEVRVDLERRR